MEEETDEKMTRR